ncbi:MAG: hypothetical protein HY901_01505 [Deltaproteobacteria bacterium]|nr:hypothetical protein [Deltaproteobacteria bacterium]
MENVERRSRKWTSLKQVPRSTLSGLPYLLKRCDAEDCEALATEHCSHHGVHFCRRHFEDHREDWHTRAWETPMAIARC